MMASCWPEFSVYAADQSGVTPISLTIMSRSSLGTCFLMNVLSLGHASLGGIQSRVGRSAQVNGDLAGIHLREELAANERNLGQRADEEAKHAD